MLRARARMGTARGPVSGYIFSAESSLLVYDTPAEQEAAGVSLDGADGWDDIPAVCASRAGIGEDNPTNPNTLTAEQQARVAVLQLDAVSSFDLLLSIDQCALSLARGPKPIATVGG